jgi:release factor glutamine methyltransferase
MQTIASARAWAMDEFRRAGVEARALSSDLLLGFVTGRDRVYVLSHAEDDLPDESWHRYRSLVSRHAEGEPLQYLTGEREFYGLDFRVTPAVLIPRPETEILVEAALHIIQNNLNSNVRFADVGAGSGCIAVTIAREALSSGGWATDISWPALGIARFNAARHKVAERIQFVRADLLGCFAREPVFDLILSNPPYVAPEEYDTLPSSVKDYEPRLALSGGRDGLDFYRRLAPEALPRLKAGGFLLLEAGAGQADPIGLLIEKEGLVLEEILKDLQGIPRCLIARKK